MSKLQSKNEEAILHDIDRLLKNSKFNDLLKKKIEATLDTPEVVRSRKSMISNLLDNKQFDSKNFSDQAKGIIKVWAKNSAAENLVSLVEKDAEKLGEVLKDSIIKHVPTPQACSFELFVSKSSLNKALVIIQKQLNETLSAAQNLQTIFSMWCIHAIFFDVNKAAQLVLDILSGWASTAQKTKEKIKQAARLLIDFQLKGNNIELTPFLI